jgi:nucleoside-diphosphate-sugar epimerase
MPRKILITGGCGFFGTWIIRRLLDDGDQPVVLDMARTTKRWEMILSPAEIARVPFHAIGIDDTEAVLALVAAEKPDAIIHLAALQVPTCRDNPLAGARVNVIGTLNIFEAAKAQRAAGGVLPRIVYASSAAVFGPDAEYAETHVGDSAALKPTTHYGAYKVCNESSAKAYWIANHIPSVGLRPLTVYGPGRDTGMTSFPTRAIAAALLGQPFDIPFNGRTAYIHMREVADMFVTAAHQPMSDGLAYTVGGDIVDMREFIAAVDRQIPGAARLITCSGAPLPIASKVDDASLRASYPGLLRIPLEQGLRETIEVFRRLQQAGTLTV